MGKKKGGAAAKMDPIFDAADNGDEAAVKALLKADAALVNSRNGDGWTPLIQASYAGEADICTLLLKAGADVNAQCRDGDTPMHYASAQGHQDVLKVLGKQKGVNLMMQDKDGEDPRDVAQNPKVKKLIEQLVTAQREAEEADEGEDAGEDGEGGAAAE